MARLFRLMGPFEGSTIWLIGRLLEVLASIKNSPKETSFGFTSTLTIGTKSSPYTRNRTFPRTRDGEQWIDVIVV